ncbi:MAG: hypothetical protein ACYDDS_18075 [Candidatus Sulfotelmatobacter sp.]|jgi:hypothetical protein
MGHKFEFNLFADYFQFYMQDETVEGDLSECWTKEAVNRLLAVTEGKIGVGTVRNMMVPVVVEVADAEPDEAETPKWDQVNECDLMVKSGRIVVAGCTDYFPDAARIEVPPGSYRVRLYYGDLNSLSEDELEGNDHYRIVLWRTAPAPLKVLKQCTNLRRQAV